MFDGSAMRNVSARNLRSRPQCRQPGSKGLEGGGGTKEALGEAEEEVVGEDVALYCFQVVQLAVGVGVGVCVGVRDCVGEGVGVRVGVIVAVAEGVSVPVREMVDVGEKLTLGVRD